MADAETSRAATHRALRVLLSFVLLCATACGGSTWGQAPVMSDATVRASPELQPRDQRAGSPRAQDAFERATELYRSGDFTRAADAFRFFLSDHAGDPLAYRAEAWLGRALLAAGDPHDARRVFASLAERRQPADAHALGELYLAWLAVSTGDHAGSQRRIRTLLQRSPDVRVAPGWAVDGDEALLASLLARARLDGADPASALIDLEAVETTSRDDALRAWAVTHARALAARRLDDTRLVQMVQAPASFPRAVAAGPLIERYLAAGDDASARLALQLATGPMLAHGLEAELAQYTSLVHNAGQSGAASWGLVVSLTGPDRRAGRAVLGAVLLAQGAFEARTPSSEVWIEDAGGDREMTARAVARLAERGVPVVVGPVEPALADVARREAAARGIVYLGLEAVPGAPADAGAWRLSWDMQAEAAAVVHAMRGGGATRFAVVRQDAASPVLDAFADAAEAAITAAGGAVVARSTLDRQATQQAAERAARDAHRARADGVVLATGPDGTAVMAAWLSSTGLWCSPTGRVQGGRVVWATSSLGWGESVVRNSSAYVDGMIVPQWYGDTSERQRARLFRARFEQVVGRPPGPLEAFAWDAATLARSLLLDEGLRTSAQVAERLRAGYRYEGAAGAVELRDGGVVRAPELARSRGDRLEAP